jgi:transcription elongation factor GreB
MSRGFVKEEDQEEIPLVLPRAILPDGVTNYVTKVGMDELLEEKQNLIDERKQLKIKNDNEKRIAVNHINAKLQLLNDRISTAKLVDPKEQPKHEVRFGALVTLKIGNDVKLQQYQIVGVDESDISKRKISFLSPIAKILTNKKVGDEVTLKLAKEDRILKVMEITY